MTVWGTAIAQALALFLLAPLVQGVIQRLKAAFQGRRGPRILQPYFTLGKAWRRQDVRPQAASWVFALAPRLVVGAVLASATAVPLFWRPERGGWTGDFILAVAFLALARFVLSLAGLDGGTPFGGLGSSRESTIGALVEPALFALALPWMVLAGSTGWPALIAASAATTPASVVRFLGLVAAIIVALAETGRLPVDNPDTHLELTMIHEAMELEYSGPQLALLALAQMAKQLLVLAIVADLLLPWGSGGLSPVPQVALALIKWAGLAVALGVAESLSVKLRFFRLPGYLGAATALSSAAAVLQVWGGR